MDADARRAADDLVGFLTPVLKAYGTDRGFETTVAMQQILRAALPEIAEDRLLELHVALVSTIGRSEAQHLPVERLAAGVSAWFGVTQVDQYEDILIQRMREALIAATGMHVTSIGQDLAHLLERSRLEGWVIDIRDAPVPPLAMGRAFSRLTVSQATPARQLFREQSGRA